MSLSPVTVSDDELTDKQLVAIPALLGSKTVREAADKSGVSESTLHRLLRSQIFQVAYRESCRWLVHQAMVLRTAKKDKKAGDQFWGCTQYPRCLSIVKA